MRLFSLARLTPFVLAAVAALGAASLPAAAQTITTGNAARQVVLPDSSSVSVAANSQVRIGGFTGGAQSASTGGVSVDVARGAVRFATGNLAPSSYKIRTPMASVGIRGTTVDIFVRSGREIFLVIDGNIEVCTRNPRNCTLVSSGQYVTVGPDGALSQPATWTGPTVDISTELTFVDGGGTLGTGTLGTGTLGTGTLGAGVLQPGAFVGLGAAAVIGGITIFQVTSKSSPASP